MVRFVLWGTGYWAEKCYCVINENREDYKIIAYCDNDYKKWGNYYHDKNVIPPTSLRNLEFDILVIANSFEKEIKEEIQKLNLCNIRKVYTVYELISLIYSKNQYYELAKKVKIDKTVLSGNSEKCIVYTALIGKGDMLKDPEYISPDITYICFTDNKDLHSDVWNIEYIQKGKESDVMLARKIKILPWEYISMDNMNADRLVYWVDAKFLIVGDLREYKEKYWKHSGMLLFPHYERKCICDETAEIIPYKPEIKHKVIMQTAAYLKDGYPINYGLYETGCMVRDIFNERIKKVMGLWWNELQKFTYRDQISFPYICWKNDFYPDVSDTCVNHNEWIMLKR